MERDKGETDTMEEGQSTFCWHSRYLVAKKVFAVMSHWDKSLSSTHACLPTNANVYAYDGTYTHIIANTVHNITGS